MAHPLESYTFDISAYVDAALELDVQAREQWLSEMHNCAPRVVARLRAYLIECIAVSGGSLSALEKNQS